MRIFQYLAMLAILIIPVTALAGNGSIIIENGEGIVKTRRVVLNITPTPGAIRMRIGNTNDFVDGSGWIPVDRSVRWELEFHKGRKDVYVQFHDRNNRFSDIFSDNIVLSAPVSMTVTANLDNNSFETSSRNVRIISGYTEGIEDMRVINGTGSFDRVDFFPVQSTFNWVISSGEGKKIITIEYRDVNKKIYRIEKEIRYNEPVNHIPEGSILKGSADAVYYLGYGGMLHPFLHPSVYHAFYSDFSNITHTSDVELRRHHVGSPVCMRAGTWLVKFQIFPRVYAVEPGCRLRPIRSEAEAYILYGSNWNKRIIDLSPVFSSLYTVREHTTLNRDDDRDRDGVEDDVEREYRSSDNKVDTDNDKLSDYEEIYYWFTDPTNSDTDGDGMTDGVEVLNGRRPNGSGDIEEISEGTYEHPYGTVVYRYWSDKKYYYSEPDGHIYFLADSLRGDGFTSNGFQSRFVVSPPVEFQFIPRKGWIILSDSEDVRDPVHTSNGRILPL